jgi:hypothetical protein
MNRLDPQHLIYSGDLKTGHLKTGITTFFQLFQATSLEY